MSLEINGKITQMMDPTSGQGSNGQWTKRDFVIETADQYPKKVCFSAWNDKAAQLNGYQVGAQVKVSFDVQSREYNQKWYTDLRIWKIEALGGQPAQGAPAQNYQQQPSAPMQQNNPVESFGSDDKDDLPF
ncbi:MAG: DUF3127 domain-containing protein [Bacteroidota bacterium]